ncbi:LOW QUALITY PROTEIN: platelet glycoprotein VI-like [Sminthopsis crassicaudata]|uniref:LOW QUALITY PROTEIN: platelet glycoprotein VI-like n=1 Tax=Sminthopsis crassicaudata TaxID=9301 RepID=UPI003D6800CF
MRPLLSALLCLGLCLGHRMRAQADELPRPSLRAENGSLGPLGSRMTFRCRGSPGAAEYLLEKDLGRELKVIDSVQSEEVEVKFSISIMTLNDAGTYSCSYRTASRWSERSDPLELVVTERYHPPSLSAWPGSTVAEGQNVSLQCRAENRYDRSALYKDGEQVTQASAQLREWGSLASFLIPAVTSAHGGTYRCYSFQSHAPHEWSSPSDPLELRVTGASKDPPLPHSPGDTQALTSSPPKTNTENPEGQNWLFGLSKKHASILLGVSALLILLFLLLLLLLCCRRHRARISEFLGLGAAGGGPEPQGRLTPTLPTGNGSREVKKTPKSSDPAATPMEESLYAAVEDGRQIEEARPEDTAAPTGEDPQQVTYAQLTLRSLGAGAQDPPPSGPAAPSLYAALR